MSKEILELVKSLPGIVGAILGVILGYILALYGRRKERKRRARNVRRMVAIELMNNYTHLISWMPRNENDGIQAQYTAAALVNLRTTAFQIYLSNLVDLEVDDKLEVDRMIKLYEVHYKIQRVQAPVNEYSRMSPEEICGTAHALLAQIGRAIETLKGGEEILKSSESRRYESMGKVIEKWSRHDN